MTREAIERETISYTLALQVRELLDKARTESGLDGAAADQIWQGIEERVQELVFGADE